MSAAASKYAATFRMLAALCSWLIAAASPATVRAEAEPRPITLIQQGVPKLPIIAGSVKEPVAELRRYLRRMTGVDFETEPRAECREPRAESKRLSFGIFRLSALSSRLSPLTRRSRRKRSSAHRLTNTNMIHN